MCRLRIIWNKIRNEVNSMLVVQVIGGVKIYLPYIILIAALIILAITGVLIILESRRRKRIRSEYEAVFDIEEGAITGDDELDEIIEAAGYSYDPEQDIFYSKLNPWQRKMGYCRLYDEASAPLNMIFDCEPIYFEYDGKRWLIEFWKGQYGMTTGGEIGIYNTEGPDLVIPGFFNGTFYYCAGDEDLLNMSFTLLKDGEILFTREAKHWWLTGFKLGDFAEPSDLAMYAAIAFKDEEMCKAFLEGLIKAGYSEEEIYTDGIIVGLVFDEPRTPQPISRVPETDWLIQRKNEYLCKKYQEITEPYESFPEKINAIRELAPEIYDVITNLGKNRQLFEIFDKIKDYLN
jgi:hypothetical protein